MPTPRRTVRITVRTFEENFAKLKAIAKGMGMVSPVGKLNISAALNFILTEVDVRRYRRPKNHPAKRRVR